MKKHLLSLLGCGLILASCQPEAPSPFRIESGRVGPLMRTHTTPQLDSIFATDSLVRDTVRMPLGTSGKVEVFEKGGKHLLTLSPAGDSLGLIARFVALPTLSARDRAAWPAWAGDRPADWRAFAASAPGFETWRARLLERLGAWDSPSVPDLSAPGADLRLKSLWIADWVAERWGEENLLAASMEIDPWVASAIDRLIEPHTAQAPRDLRPAE